MDVGTTLREARLRAGLSPERLAERTKIQPETITALEQNALEHLLPGIYLDGIVRVYACEVGLDPEALVQQVRAERRRPRVAAPVPLEPLDAELVEEPVDPEPVDAELAGAESFGDVEHLELVPRDSDSPPPPLAPMEPPPSSRAASPLMAIALIGAVVGAFAVGAYLYESSSDVPEARSVEATAAPVAPDQSSDIDPNEGGVGTTGTPAAEAATPAEARAETPDDPVGEPAVAAGSADAPRERLRAMAPASDVSGAWTFATRVESSSVAGFQGLRLGYQVDLQQKDNRVTGTGSKTAENGRTLAAAGQTPIAVEGTVEGNRLRLTFTERGARRQSSGTFVLNREADDLLRGEFTSDAARSSGTVEARRR